MDWKKQNTNSLKEMIKGIKKFKSEQSEPTPHADGLLKQIRVIHM